MFAVEGGLVEEGRRVCMLIIIIKIIFHIYVLHLIKVADLKIVDFRKMKRNKQDILDVVHQNIRQITYLLWKTIKFKLLEYFDKKNEWASIKRPYSFKFDLKKTLKN